MSSPSVQVQEFDKTHYIPRLTNEVAAFVGHFERGPIDTPIFITNVDEFKFLFGRGIGNHTNDWYQVYNYLQYASGVYVIRTSGKTRVNANNGDPIYINTYRDWLDSKDTISTNNIRFIARTAGAWGNLLSVAVITKNSWDGNPSVNGSLKAKEIFEFFEDDHLGIAIFRDGVLVEKYYKSYFNVDSINDESLYVYVKIDDTLLSYEELTIVEDFLSMSGVLDLGGLLDIGGADSLGLLSTVMVEHVDLGTDLQTFDDFIENNYSYYGNTLIEFQNGFNAFPTDPDFSTSYEILENKEQFDIDILIGNDKANHLAVALAEKRKDCIAFIGLPTSFITYLKLLMGTGNPDEIAYTNDGLVIATNEYKIPTRLTDTALNEFNKYINAIPNSQFVHFTMNIKVQKDLFSNSNKLINIAGDTAGLKAQASLVSPWTASAGLEKGKIKNAVKMHLNINEKHTKDYYKKGLNFVQNNVLMTQKTYYTKASAFNRINVRSLFNHLEKNTTKILNNYVFEENTLRIRQNIATQVKRYLEDVRINKGIQAGRVGVYPSDTNPNEIVVEIAIQPTYVAEYIVLRMTNTGTTEISTLL